jgi:transcriptional regulator with XRE-family HTH domain
MKKQSEAVSRTARVRSVLILKGITLRDLAKRAGVTPRFIDYLLKGERNSPRVQKLISQVTGISFSSLWSEDNQKKGGGSGQD